MATLHAHPIVWETAQGIARTMYEEMMLNNTLYAQWKACCPELTPKKLEELFVSQMAPKLLEQARATLAKLLAQPGNESLKDTIAEALIADATVRHGRKLGNGLRI